MTLFCSYLLGSGELRIVSPLDALAIGSRDAGKVVLVSGFAGGPRSRELCYLQIRV